MIFRPLITAICAIGLATTLALAGYVRDEAGLLNLSEQQVLESWLSQFEQTTHHQLAVVTLKTLNDRQIDDVAIDLFKKMGIGRKGKDDGILLLVAANDRKIRIEVGYGLEPLLNDGKAGHLIKTTILPFFRSGNYSKGVLNGSLAIIQTIAVAENVTLATPQAAVSRTAASVQNPAASFLGLLIVLGIFFILVKVAGQGNSNSGKWLLLGILASMMSSGSSWGGRGDGFGSGSSFGGFGGGFSGGGGASSGW